MNTNFEKSANTTDEWYTPKEIIDALGKFDLDPCAPVKPLWKTAETMYNKNHDGLTKDWVGRVWLNPPYSRPLIERFITRLAEHGNGIALLFNRCDSKMFQDVIFEKATRMYWNGLKRKEIDMDTKRTLYEIEVALSKHDNFNFIRNIIAFNVNAKYLP